jgi:hypothetical protein
MMTISRTVARRATAMALAFLVGISVVGPAGAVGSGGTDGGGAAVVRYDPAPNATFLDARRDARPGIDTRWVWVWNRRGSPYIKVTLGSRNYSAQRAQIAEVYFDVNGRHKGPEYAVLAFSKKDDDAHKGTTLFRTNRDFPWRLKKGTRCQVVGTTFKVGGADQIRMAVAKKCIGGPGAIRVHAKVWDVKRYRKGGWRGWNDAAPGPKSLYRWVKPKG